MPGKAAEIGRIEAKRVLLAASKAAAAAAQTDQSAVILEARALEAVGQSAHSLEHIIHEAEAYLAPVALQADEGIASAERAGAGIRIHRGLDLEDRLEAAAEVFRTAKAETRGVAGHSGLVAICVTGRVGNADAFDVHVETAVNLDVGLCLSRLQPKCGCGDGAEGRHVVLVHIKSPIDYLYSISKPT